MNLQSCEHPQRVYNKVLGCYIHVPCGKCNMCCDARAARWNQRLDCEFQCWKYTVMYTLTYQDYNLPTLSLYGMKDEFDRDNAYLVHNMRQHVDCMSGEILDRFDDACNFVIPCPAEFWNDDSQKQFEFYGRKLPYCSPYDHQKFIKRIRKKLSQNDSERKTLRYYSAPELGPDTYRPHWHGLLFFDSDWLASNIENVLSEAWPFGDWDESRCTFKFITDFCPHYASSYINCAHRYPSVYAVNELKPHALFSKSPAIGTLFVPDEKIREIFDSSAPVFSVDNHAGIPLYDVPLWRVFEDRLFPRLPLFGELSPKSRRRIHSKLCSFEAETYQEFEIACVQYINLNPKDELSVYLVQASQSWSTDTRLRGVYHVINRIEAQRQVFGSSLNDYITHIEDYYDNKRLYLLKNMYTFQSDLAGDSFDSRALIWMDLEYCRHLLSCTRLTSADFLILESYGFTLAEISDAQRFRNLLTSLKYDKQASFISSVELHRHIVEDSHKNRSKHERYDLYANTSY